MFYPDLYPSKDIQENIFKSITKQDIEEFFDKYLAQYYLTNSNENIFSTKLYCASVEWQRRKFEPEQLGDNVIFFMSFSIINDCSVRSFQRLGCTLFNIFDYYYGNGMNNIVDYENLTKKWIKFLKEKFPEYAPLFEEYKNKVKNRIENDNRKRIEFALDQNQEDLNKFENLFSE